MYLASITLLMFVFPALSILAETLVLHGHVDPLPLLGKWFVFWGVGIRLLTAGVRQVLEPSYTAETIFRIKDAGAHKLVSEIGFGNLAIGALGAATLVVERWVLPAALVGCIFYALAGMQHVLNANRTQHETIAMVSDLAMALLLGVYIVAVSFIAIAFMPL